MTASIVYTGNLRCEAQHIQSKTEIETDAPTDNKGKGERFSPTDLLCVSLATCMLTTMGIKATDMGIDISQSVAHITKHMLAEPRRVGRVEVSLTMKGIADEKDRKILERVGDNCPVMKSLHPDLKVKANYTWS